MARIVEQNQGQKKDEKVTVLSTEPLPSDPTQVTVALDKLPLSTDGAPRDDATARNPDRPPVEAPKPKRFRVLSHGTRDGGGKFVTDPNGGGRVFLHEGKEISEQHYDVKALKKQGVRLEEIHDDELEA